MKNSSAQYIQETRELMLGARLLTNRSLSTINVFEVEYNEQQEYVQKLEKDKATLSNEVIELRKQIEELKASLPKAIPNNVEPKEAKK